MKKLISTVLSLCLILTLLAACGGKPAGEAAPADSAAPAADGRGRRARRTHRQPEVRRQRPHGRHGRRGERAAAELGVEFKKIESSPASFEEDIRSMSQEGYDLVITTFGYMSDATKLVAQEFPDTKYAAIFQEINTPEEPVANLWDAVFRGQTTFYVDGYIAGLATKTNRVGFIVGGEEPGPNAEGNGFMRGRARRQPRRGGGICLCQL